MKSNQLNYLFISFLFTGSWLTLSPKADACSPTINASSEFIKQLTTLDLESLNIDADFFYTIDLNVLSVQNLSTTKPHHSKMISPVPNKNSYKNEIKTGLSPPLLHSFHNRLC